MRESPLRVLMVANLPPHVLGGAENQSARLAGAWAALGAHVDVAGHRIPTGSQPLNGHPVATWRIGTFEGAGRLGRGVGYFLGLAWFLVRHQRRFDVIYTRGLSDAALTICALRALGIVRRPLVACPINARGAGEAAMLRSLPFSRLWIRLLDRQCNTLNMIAPAIGADVAALGIHRPRIAAIPNGIELRPLRRPSRAPGPRRLLWTGRLGPQKGLDLLLPALATAAGQGLDFHLELVGEGPDREALEAQARSLGLAGKIHFAGPLPEADVRERLLSCDVFVLPSRYEGMSNSALEAMEAGLPCLLTRCGGIDTYVHPGIGWTCDTESVPSLAEALVAMLTTGQDQLERMGRESRLLVEQSFDIREVARRNLSLLADAAAQGR
jgi:glycosyltransferase involved in cell wall biosynthesis